MTRRYDYRRYNKNTYEKKGLTIGHIVASGLAGTTLFAFAMRGCNSLNSNTANQLKNTPGIESKVQSMAQKPVQPSIAPYNEPGTTDYDSLVERIRDNANKIQPANYKNYIESSLERVLEQWYGTKWDMNGATMRPGAKKQVGCDYLVIRALEALGYNFDLDKLGWDSIADKPTSWLASEKIVKASSSNAQEFWGMSYKKFKKYLEKQEDGFYVVGLDKHVGFLHKKKSELYFIHSSENPYGKVVKQKADDVSSLRHSNVYVIGKLFTDDKLGDFFQRQYKPINISGQ